MFCTGVLFHAEVDVRCYILYYTLPSPILISISSFPIFPSYSSPSSSSDLISDLSSSFLPLLAHNLSPLHHSFYTCRVFHNLIYILPTSDNLTPHVLSEWMVEVCGAYLYRVVFVLVCSFRAGLTLGVYYIIIILYIILYYYTYTYYISYTILFSSTLPSFSSLLLIFLTSPSSLPLIYLLFPSSFILYLSRVSCSYLCSFDLFSSKTI